MKILLTLIITLACTVTFYGQNHRQPNPFESIGKAPKKILTLSDGKYQEFFFNDTLRRVGSVMFNTITGKIAYFIDKDSISSEDVNRSALVSRWLSQDPLARNYPSMSPYNFTGNNPIMFIDPNGGTIVDPASGLPVEQVGGNWKTVIAMDDQGNKTYGNVSARFTRKTLPVLNSLSASEIGNLTIDKMQAIPTEIELIGKNKNSLQYASKVFPGAGEIQANPKKNVREDGYLKKARFNVQMKAIDGMGNKNNREFDEVMVAVIQVEMGHISLEEVANAIKYGYGYGNYFSQEGTDGQQMVFEPLYNDFVSAVISFRDEHGKHLDEDAFSMVTRMGWTLTPENQKRYDQVLEIKGKAMDEIYNQLENEQPR